MKICVFGAGALGGVFGGYFALGGEDVTMIARGATLATLKDKGLTLIAGDKQQHAKPRLTDDPKSLGTQDIVIVATKAYSLPQAAEAIAPMLGPDTGVVLLQNGLQWWYCHGLGGALEGRRLNSIDAEGKCETLIGLSRTIGAEIYCPAEVTAPGTIRHGAPVKIVMAEATGKKTPRIEAFAAACGKSGIVAEIAADMRLELWKKLLSLIAGAPVAVLTGATARPLNREEGTRAVMARLTAEAMAVAAKLGVKLPQSALDRFKQPADVPPNKVSTLQDLERNRPLEIDAIVGVVAEMGRITGVPTPTVDAVYALCRQLAVERGLYPANPGFSLDYKIG
jgi:2-dehydropantoate 2-reductase